MHIKDEKKGKSKMKALKKISGKMCKDCSEKGKKYCGHC